MKHLLTVIIVAFAVSPCVVAQNQPPKKVSAEGRKMGLARPLVFEKDKEVYGAKLKHRKHITLGTIASKPKDWNDKELQLRGKITGVCKKKGCWMMLQDGKEDVRIRFTGYSFFVPLDCAGRQVTCEGRVKVRVESEAQRRHYAEDAGLSRAEIEKIKGDKVIMSFEADAVQVGTPPAKKAASKKKTEKKG